MQTAAWLLIGGLLTFGFGAAIPVRWLEVWFSELERYLELISQHRRSWTWLNGFMIAAVLMTAAGFSLIAARLGHPALLAGAATFAIGSVMWILVASYRATTAVWAADQMSATGQVPEVFKALDAWTGRWYQLYIATAYASEFAVGLGLLSGAVVPAWVCIFTMGVGLAGLLSVLPGFSRLPLLSAVFDVPIVVHLAPAIIGGSVLVR
jgi:hypothetical protein